MQEKLEACGIACKAGHYRGEKDCMILCAEHLGFLATM